MNDFDGNVLLIDKPRHETNKQLKGRDVKFVIQIGSDWHQMGNIWDFLRLVSVQMGSPIQNVLKLILKSPRFVPFGANLTQFG